jgi:hypothetical protein
MPGTERHGPDNPDMSAYLHESIMNLELPYLGYTSFHNAHFTFSGRHRVEASGAAAMLSASTRVHMAASDRGPLVPLPLRPGGKVIPQSRTRNQLLPLSYGVVRAASRALQLNPSGPSPGGISQWLLCKWSSILSISCC